MELTHEDVLEILELLEGSNVEYLELEVNGTQIVADRSGAGAASRQRTKDAAAAPVGEDAAATAGEDGAAIAGDDAAASPQAATSPSGTEAASDEGQRMVPSHDGDDLTTITAPMVGVFYRSPEPGAPPFVGVGDEVTEDSTVGLIEVMKMFNSVTAGARGQVAEILVENEAFVEYGQPLMTIRQA